MEKFVVKKRYGQNFITDKNLIKKIVSFADITKNDVVVEVGPGQGALTSEILKLSKFGLIYEIDGDLQTFLSEKLNNFTNYDLKFLDFMTVDLSVEIKNLDYEKLIFISNLPYYITSPVVKKVVDSGLFDKILVMVQDEVASRFNAKPRTRDYGYMTVYLNACYEVKKVLKISRNLFNPVPNVDSALVLMEKKNDDKIVDFKKFDRFVADSFRFKRKTLKNNLVGYDLFKIEKVLSKYGFSLQNRAEDIPVDIYIEVANYL